MIGYISGLPVLDISGLTDRFIGRSPGPILHKDYDVGYIFDRRPEYIVLVSASVGTSGGEIRFDPGKLWFQGRRIAADPRFAARYRPVLVRVAKFEGALILFRARSQD
jgi:hypothetical protein